MTLEKLISNFELLGDWEERYGYLIDLGKKLPGLTDSEKSEENRVHGCQAMVWLILESDAERPGALRIRADSDAFIVRGLIAVLQLIFNGRTPEEILATDAKSVLGKLGLDKHLSPTRKNGLFAMVERIRALASGKGSGLNGREVMAQVDPSHKHPLS
jgi:cysteine desulfuration protein SufE